MVILSKPEKEKLVLDLYNQNKTYREIAQQLRISPRDIGAILNKAAAQAAQEKERDKEEPKYQNQNENNNNNNSLPARAYDLFSKGKSPIEVAIALNLDNRRIERLWKDYCKLNQLHALSKVYQEVKDDIIYFLDLYKMARAEGMGPEEVVNLLQVANNNKNGCGLKAIEKIPKSQRGNKFPRIKKT